MLRRCAIFLFLLAFLLSGCAKENVYRLSFTADGSDKIDLIHDLNGYQVYLLGGMAVCTIDGEPAMLEMALDNGDITPADIINSADDDVSNEDRKVITDIEGVSCYCYDLFNIFSWEAEDGAHLLCFAPAEKEFFEIVELLKDWE